MYMEEQCITTRFLGKSAQRSAAKRILKLKVILSEHKLHSSKKGIAVNVHRPTNYVGHLLYPCTHLLSCNTTG